MKKVFVLNLFLAILATSCRFSDPVIGIRTFCEKGVYKSLNTKTNEWSTERNDSAHYVDTTVYFKYTTKICLDFSNKSIFAEISKDKIRDANKNIRYKGFSRKVPAFIWDGWVRYYHKDKEFKQNKASTTGVILNLFQDLPVVAHHPPLTLKQVQGYTVDDEYRLTTRIHEVL